MTILNRSFTYLEGEGTLRIGLEQNEYAVKPGDVVRIPPCTIHSIRCNGSKPLRYVAIDCFIAGRPVDEPTWDSHVKVMCEREGWPRIEGQALHHERTTIQ